MYPIKETFPNLTLPLGNASRWMETRKMVISRKPPFPCSCFNVEINVFTQGNHQCAPKAAVTTKRLFKGRNRRLPHGFSTQKRCFHKGGARKRSSPRWLLGNASLCRETEQTGVPAQEPTFPSNERCSHTKTYVSTWEPWFKHKNCRDHVLVGLQTECMVTRFKPVPIATSRLGKERFCISIFVWEQRFPSEIDGFCEGISAFGR